ncbi:MAG TPA: hypothetical protein VK141_02350, partial [Nitrosomonas sp.]|nr:hypothetical protein [Nitrosomonas sp.]
MTLSDSLQYNAKNIHVFGDSLTFIDKKSDVEKTVALHDIVEMNRTSHYTPLLQGAVMTVAALSIENFHLHRPTNSLLEGTAIAGTIGTLGAACIGSPERYVFNRDSLKAHYIGLERSLLDEYDHDIRNVVSYGIPLGDYCYDNSGSFHNVHGFTVGFSTGINLYSEKEEQYVLGLELMYNKIVDYRTNVKRDFFNYHHVSDEQYVLTFLDIGIHPEYLFTFNNNFTLRFYAGGSIGIGGENQTVNELSRTIIDSTYQGYFTTYGPY